MLRTLLESRSRKAGNGTGAAASAGIHVTLILLAAFATAAGAPPDAAQESPDLIHWVATKSEVPPKVAPPARVPSTRTIMPVNLPAVSLAINTSIPAVDIPLGVVRSDDFVSSTTHGDGTINGSTETAGIAKPAYDAQEVDKAVTAISGIAPSYPAAMRSAGIEGDVRAEFVVDEKGCAVTSSLRILSSSNVQFSEAVRQALPRMRFAPAQLRGRAVPQTVQQLFAFRLNR